MGHLHHNGGDPVPQECPIIRSMGPPEVSRRPFRRGVCSVELPAPWRQAQIRVPACPLCPPHRQPFDHERMKPQTCSWCSGWSGWLALTCKLTFPVGHIRRPICFLLRHIFPEWPASLFLETSYCRQDRCWASFHSGLDLCTSPLVAGQYAVIHTRDSPAAEETQG